MYNSYFGFSKPPFENNKLYRSNVTTGLLCQAMAKIPGQFVLLHGLVHEVHKLFSHRTISPGPGGLYTSVRGQRSPYPCAFGAAHGLPAEARESSANTRMIIRGRFSAVVDSSITPA
jgi:hypothetical protein